jgi:hypothetical protein
LANISNYTNLGDVAGKGFSKSILEASDAAIKLRSHLEAAVDVKTDKLDLSKFA